MDNQPLIVRFGAGTGACVAPIVPLLMLALSAPAAAQDIVVTPSTGISVESSGSPTGFTTVSVDERTRRTRIALYASAGATVAGSILLITSLSQCEEQPNAFGQNEVVCNRAGDALTISGGITIGIGLVGLTVSGIMLGVRKRKLKKEASQPNEVAQRDRKRVHWDPSTSRFVF